MASDNVTVVSQGLDGSPEVVPDVPRETPEGDKPAVTEPPKVEDKKTEKPWKDKTEAERLEYGMQKRIDKLTAKLNEREEVIRDLQQQQPRPNVQPERPLQPVVQTNGRPSPLANEDPVDFLERLTDWKMEQRGQVQKQKEAQENQIKTDQELLTEWNKKVSKATGKYDDFEEVTNSADVPLAPYMARAMMESEVGADIAYYLGNNPAEAKRIVSLSPTAQAREIGRLEARFTEQSGGRKVSSAPDPINPIGDKGTTGRVEKAKTLDDPNLSDAEWRALRNEELRNRRRR